MTAATPTPTAGSAAIHTGPTRTWPVTTALARRSLLGMARVPATVIPVVIMPVFFTIAFSGAFSALTELPAFPTDDILNWMVPFAVLQGAAFAGLGASFGVGRDLENGFYDRLLLAPAPRRALFFGPVLFSAGRAMLPFCVVLPIGLLGGARLVDPVAGVVVLFVAAVGCAVVSALWGLGVTFRTKTQRSGSLVQVGIFITIFLSTGQVPLTVMTGWLYEVASRNPFTALLALARQGFIEPGVAWDTTWPGLVAIAVGLVGLGWFAERGFRRLVP